MPSNRQGEMSVSCTSTVLLKYEDSEERDELISLEKTPFSFNEAAEPLNEESKLPSATPKKR